MARTLARRGNEVAPKEHSREEAIEPFTEEPVSAPKRRTRSEAKVPSESKSSSVEGGWSAYKRTSESVTTTGSSKFLRVEDSESVLIKFIDDSPFASYLNHWVNRKPIGCIGTSCALCESVGDVPKPQILFNVIDLTDEPTLKIWQASANPTSAVEARADNPRTSPINREDLYFEISKKKKDNNFFEYSVDPIKARDLLEDWGIEPLTAEQINELALDAKDSNFVKLPSRSDVSAVAKSLLDVKD